MGYVVTAGYVTVPTAVEGGVAHVDIPHGADLPADVPAETARALLARGDVAESRGGEEPGEPVDPDAVPDGSAAAVLAWVGDDKDRAACALEAEQAKGDQARKGLTADLVKLVEA